MRTKKRLSKAGVAFRLSPEVLDSKISGDCLKAKFETREVKTLAKPRKSELEANWVVEQFKQDKDRRAFIERIIWNGFRFGRASSKPRVYFTEAILKEMEQANIEITMTKDETIYLLSVDDIQYHASEKLGRKLTNDEIRSVKKGVDSALSFGIDTVLDTAIEEAISG